MAVKYYAVKKGKTPGIYMTWDACKAVVDGYPGAVYKSFKTKEEAETFIGTDMHMQLTSAKVETANPVASRLPAIDAQAITETTPAVYAFVDGSYNIATKVYGYGGYIVYDGKKEVLQGSGNEEEMASMRNVAGEVLGSMAAMKRAVELGLSELAIYYDYLGIEMWATGSWKRNKTGTIAYYDYVNSIRDRIHLTFIKVKGHSGVAGNEEADKLAKQAVGIIE